MAAPHGIWCKKIHISRLFTRSLTPYPAAAKSSARCPCRHPQMLRSPSSGLPVTPPPCLVASWPQCASLPPSLPWGSLQRLGDARRGYPPLPVGDFVWTSSPLITVSIYLGIICSQYFLSLKSPASFLFSNRFSCPSGMLLRAPSPVIGRLVHPTWGGHAVAPTGPVLSGVFTYTHSSCLFLAGTSGVTLEFPPGTPPHVLGDGSFRTPSPWG